MNDIEIEYAINEQGMIVEEIHKLDGPSQKKHCDPNENSDTHIC